MAFSTPPGPGHGKAVISSYMLANERAMQRGMVLSTLAALLQAIVAIALVGVASVLFGVTARTMTAAASVVEVRPSPAIAGFGAWLWSGARARRSLRSSARARRTLSRVSDATTPATVPHGARLPPLHRTRPEQLAEDFSWRQGVATVLAAGSRPCSGALLAWCSPPR